MPGVDAQERLRALFVPMLQRSIVARWRHGLPAGRLVHLQIPVECVPSQTRERQTPVAPFVFLVLFSARALPSRRAVGIRAHFHRRSVQGGRMAGGHIPVQRCGKSHFAGFHLGLLHEVLVCADSSPNALLPVLLKGSNHGKHDVGKLLPLADLAFAEALVVRLGRDRAQVASRPVQLGVPVPGENVGHSRCLGLGIDLPLGHFVEAGHDGSLQVESPKPHQQVPVHVVRMEQALLPDSHVPGVQLAVFLHFPGLGPAGLVSLCHLQDEPGLLQILVKFLQIGHHLKVAGVDLHKLRHDVAKRFHLAQLVHVENVQQSLRFQPLVQGGAVVHLRWAAPEHDLLQDAPFPGRDGVHVLYVRPFLGAISESPAAHELSLLRVSQVASVGEAHHHLFGELLHFGFLHGRQLRGPVGTQFGQAAPKVLA